MRAATNGVVIAQVTDNQDPDGIGRIQVRFPWLREDDQPRWLPVASPMAGPGRGLFVMPEPEDEALVAFEHGDFDHGYIVGFLWNEQHRPPTASPDERIIQSREGHKIRFLDAESVAGNRGALVVEDAHGNAVAMTNGVMRIYAQGHLDILASSMTIMNRPVNPVGGAI